MPLTSREVQKELDRLGAQPATTEDWRDLYELIQTYERRRLTRAILASPRRADLIEAIRLLALGAM
jgi:hypothetical protein